jgi:hypothetical protein
MLITFLVRRLKRKEKNKIKKKKYYSRRKKVHIVLFLKKSWTPYGGETWVRKSAYEEVSSLANKSTHWSTFLSV